MKLSILTIVSAALVAAADGGNNNDDTPDVYNLATNMENSNSKYHNWDIAIYSQTEHDGTNYLYARPRVGNPANFVVNEQGNLAPLTNGKTEHTPLVDKTGVWAFAAQEDKNEDSQSTPGGSYAVNGNRFAVSDSDHDTNFYVCEKGNDGMPMVYRKQSGDAKGCEKIKSFNMKKVENVHQKGSSSGGGGVGNFMNKYFSPQN